MANRKHVVKKTSSLYRGSGKDRSGHDHRHGVMIWGDEVEALDEHEHGRRKVSFRGKDGWVEEHALANEHPLECYFIDVGQGDATFIVTPSGKKILIDGGLNQRALGFLAWKYRLEEPSTKLVIDLLVLSHADGDHLDGLMPIVAHPRIHVRKIIHSGIAVYAEKAYATSLGKTSENDGRKYLVTRHSSLRELSPSELSTSYRSFYDAVDRERTAYEAVDSTTADIDIGDPKVQLEVLGPRLVEHPRTGAPCLPWLGSEAETINGHSVVLRLTYGEVSVLLPGDINTAGSRHLLADPGIRARLSAHVFKAPHHGSSKFAPELLAAVAPQIAVISSGDDVDHGHPRAAFLGAVGRVMRSATPLVFSTEIAGNFVELHEPSGDEVDVASNGFARARTLFKRRLHGMINVRTDGKHLYAFRRVAAGYAWESYGPLAAAAPDDRGKVQAMSEDE